jgi:Fe-S cluster biogenesis protein NfuA/nitrite reductase/ring-hydroxylating ferredoxin subunit
MEGDGRELVARIEGVLEDLEALVDPAARALATEAVQALLDLYGEGLAHILAHVPSPEALLDDELVAHLLLLHGLHPVPVEQRVLGALDEVRPYLRSHGGDVELLGVSDGVAAVRLHGSCQGCPSSAMTLKLAVEEAVARAAPDVERVEAEGGAAPAAPAPGLLQIEPMAPGGGDVTWTTVGGLPQLAGGRPLLKDVAGAPTLFLAVDGGVYAYRPTCPGCGGSLQDAELRGAELECPGCGRTYDARRAGRCLDTPALHLEPVPLLVGEAGIVKVAVAS